MNNTSKVFWLFTITVFIGLLIPILVQQGMFLDGVTYSAISNNLANGLGSNWSPHYTKTLYPEFNEHPPLVFIIQSVFFKLLGDSYLTERIYTFLTALLTMYGIVLCFRLFIKEINIKNTEWLLVFLWITIPLVMWSYRNNLLENTMGIFTLFSFYFIIRSIQEHKLLYLLIGSILIIFSLLSKGPVGIFPLAVPFLYFLVFSKNKKHYTPLLYGIYLIVFSSLIIYILFWLIPPFKTNIIAYLEQQLLPALNNKREITTDSRFSIIGDLILDLSFPIVLLIYVSYKKWRQDGTIKYRFSKESLFFFLVAVSASLPLIISLKQRKFYLIPSIPFYIISIGLLIIPFFYEHIHNLSNRFIKRLRVISLISLVSILGFSVLLIGKYSRDKAKLSDVYTIATVIPKGSIVSTSKELWYDWGFVAYMSRIGQISLDYKLDYDYLLVKEVGPNKPERLNKYEQIDLGLLKYRLYKKK